MENEGTGTVDLKSDLEALYSNFKWNFVGILTTDDEIIPIPKNSTCITAIIEQKALLILDKFAKEKYGCTSTRPSSTREYPDTILRGGVFGSDIIAVGDCRKSAKIETSKNIAVTKPLRIDVSNLDC